MLANADKGKIKTDTYIDISVGFLFLNKFIAKKTTKTS